MKLPASLHIGHRTYSVTSWPVFEARAENARGIHLGHTNAIKIADDLTPADGGEVLIHEVLHACWRGLPEGDEERIVTTLAENLAQVIRDNPEFLACVSDALRVKSVLKESKRVRKTRTKTGR